MKNQDNASSSNATDNTVSVNAVRNKWLKRGIYAAAFLGGAYVGHKYRGQIQGAISNVVGGAAKVVSNTAEVVADTAS